MIALLGAMDGGAAFAICDGVQRDVECVCSMMGESLRGGDDEYF
jgi:hypothetical protein